MPEGGVRTAVVVRGPHERRAALSLDARAQKFLFIGGPLLALALHALTGTTVVLIATWKPSRTRTHRLGPCRTPGLRALAAALFGTGSALRALNVSSPSP
ncbi:hypothetical protein [Streptomyces toxytricini]|uniref:hypothetical protein n=1 Tax=Streptomyces toxytricini TaxID=67369 RepID=UPI003F4E2833